MSRWGNRNQQQQGIDFAKILSENHSTIDLLRVKNFVEEVKCKSSKFTQIIIQSKNRNLLYEFIDIALNPRAFMLNHNVILDKTLTHGAIQILSNLSEEFVEQIFDSPQEGEDDVVQTEKDYPILTYILKVLNQDSVQQTALAYLNKLVTPYIYQRPEEMLKIFNSQVSTNIFQYFWNKSICEILTKVLQAESEKDFFEKQKLQFVRKICCYIENEKDESKMESAIESFSNFFESLVEKHEDKYEKTKYANLLKSIISQTQNVAFLFNKFQAFNNNTQIKTYILHCIEAYLRIHLSPKPNSKVSNEGQTSTETFKLDQAFKQGLKSFLDNHKISQFNNNNRLELLSYYKVVKVFLIIEPTLSQEILTKQFLEQTIKTLLSDPNNNILHHFQREIIVSGIKQSQKVFQIIQNQIGFYETIQSRLSQKNSKNCSQNQLFLISEAVKLKSQQSHISSLLWSNVNETISKKRTFYSTIIGTNPRGNDEQKWENFETQMILKPLAQRQPQNEERQNPIEQHSKKQKKIITHMATGLEDLGGTEVLSEQEDDPFNNPSESKNNHYFDFQLPLDSDKEEQEVKNQQNSNSLEQISSPIMINIESLSSRDSQFLKESNQNSKDNDVVLDSIEEMNGEQTTCIVIQCKQDEKQISNQYNLENKEANDQEKVTLKQDLIVNDFKNQENVTQINAKLLSIAYSKSKDEVSSLLYLKYGLYLTQSVAREQIQSLLLSKYGLTIIKYKID